MKREALATITTEQYEAFNAALRRFVKAGTVPESDLYINDSDGEVYYVVHNPDAARDTDFHVRLPGRLQHGVVCSKIKYERAAKRARGKSGIRRWNLHEGQVPCLGDNYGPYMRCIKMCDVEGALEIWENYFKRAKTIAGRRNNLISSMDCAKCGKPRPNNYTVEDNATWIHCNRCVRWYCSDCCDRCGFLEDYIRKNPNYLKYGGNAFSCPNCVPCSRCGGFCNKRLQALLPKKSGPKAVRRKKAVKKKAVKKKAKRRIAR